MFTEFALFILGFYILIKGAKLLIRGASAVARLFSVSEWVIGMLIVGIGTSIPEFSINLAGQFAAGDSSLGLGTVIGSNIFNILFIIGLAAIFTPLVVKPEWVRRDFVQNSVAVVLALLFCLWPLGAARAEISRGEGILLLSAFVWWLWQMIKITPRVGETVEDQSGATFWTSFFMILGGIIGVFLGGVWVVNGAKAIALWLGLSEGLVALTIVGVGTSIPELAVSITAVINRRNGIAVGNIIGSNIFDFLGILGAVAVIRPLAFEVGFTPDLLVGFAASIWLIAVVLAGRRYLIGRWQGLLCVIFYLLYLVSLFLAA